MVFEPLPRHLAGIRVCVNLVENYALQAIWTNGEKEYEKVRGILRTCVEALIPLGPPPPTGTVQPHTISAAKEGSAAIGAPGSVLCPPGTRPVDSICVPD